MNSDWRRIWAETSFSEMLHFSLQGRRRKYLPSRNDRRSKNNSVSVASHTRDFAATALMVMMQARDTPPHHTKPVMIHFMYIRIHYLYTLHYWCHTFRGILLPRVGVFSLVRPSYPLSSRWLVILPCIFSHKSRIFSKAGNAFLAASSPAAGLALFRVKLLRDRFRWLRVASVYILRAEKSGERLVFVSNKKFRWWCLFFSSLAPDTNISTTAANVNVACHLTSFLLGFPVRIYFRRKNQPWTASSCWPSFWALPLMVSPGRKTFASCEMIFVWPFVNFNDDEFWKKVLSFIVDFFTIHIHVDVMSCKTWRYYNRRTINRVAFQFYCHLLACRILRSIWRFTVFENCLLFMAGRVQCARHESSKRWKWCRKTP